MQSQIVIRTLRITLQGISTPGLNMKPVSNTMMLLQYDSGRECAGGRLLFIHLVIKYYIGDALVHDNTSLPPLSVCIYS